VPQFDNIPSDFSPRELLELTARLNVNDPAVVRESAIDTLLEILGLTPVADTRCAGLTGGQLKRVSIGLGLITQPQVLFLDEPTTGLDSSAAHIIMEYISRVAQHLKIVVIATLHQPSRAVVSKVDDCILLAPGGHLAFCGSMEEAPVYFAQLGVAIPQEVNIADVVLELVSNAPAAAGVAGNASWAELFAHSDLNTLPSRSAYSVERIPPVRSEISRYVTLTRHFLVHYYRTPTLYVYRAILLFLMALYVGTLYFDTEERVDAMGDVAGAAFYAIWVSASACAVVAVGPDHTRASTSPSPPPLSLFLFPLKRSSLFSPLAMRARWCSSETSWPTPMPPTTTAW
jgi:ABC-type multidrug transport system ATPase subunit